MSSDSESDIEMKGSLLKKITKRQPKSPTEEHLKKEPKKLSTKEMVHSALNELKSRKGTSLYAIKKYMIERYSVDTEKINFYIKKYIKHAVESGVIIQTKGIGASGSFRLAPAKKEEKKKKKTTKKVEKTEKTEKKSTKAEEKKKPKEPKEKSKTEKKTKTSKKTENKSKKEKSAPESPNLNETRQKKMKIKPDAKEKKMAKPKIAETKMAKDGTPAKKGKNMAKRKSIGSIIKPPKMKPKRK